MRLKLLIAFLLSITLTASYANVILTTLTGEKIPFTNLKGKWVLINYWASWCKPCLDEIKELNHFYKMNNDKIYLFAVNFDDLSRPKQAQLAKELRINYPSLAADPRAALNLGDLRGVPATFVFDPEGNFSKALYGSQTLNSLKAAING
ncbi:thiol-disulfide oxidoreductase [Legionella beliardensis]|uniref:Thiol-disulfide oxidoreductase n=1 Tax=Legionella beliardensis TaxID=91822 RepID=A0A378I668_9GAMM|nr:TlpA disulfide reductase family protein [Legionella beliardensis]STX30151.1 thiol-disulfide oxidoreductase [Legionella beliardensis]